MSTELRSPATTQPAEKPPKRSLATRARAAFRQLVHEQASPERLGLAVALGAFCGLSPLYGLQTVLCLVLAQLFRLNKLAAMVGLQISAPPLTPLMAFASLQVGHRVLHGVWLALSWHEVKQMHASELLERYLGSFALGGTLLGAVFGAALGLSASQVIRAYRRVRPARIGLSIDELEPLLVALEKVPHRLRYYGAWKARLDPLYALALPWLEGRARVLDLGSGIGLLGFLLKQRSPRSEVVCVEWDPSKHDAALRLLGERAVAILGDARDIEMGSPDAIVLADVLHYFSVTEQLRWIERCADALVPKGVLLVRELGRAGWAERIEKVSVWAGWNRAGGVQRSNLSELEATLRLKGFDVETRNAGRGLFRSNVLLIAHKRAASEGVGVPASADAGRK